MATPFVTISMDDLRIELGYSGQISLGDSAVRGLALVPSGPISMSQLRGKSSSPSWGVYVGDGALASGWSGYVGYVPGLFGSFLGGITDITRFNIDRYQKTITVHYGTPPGGVAGLNNMRLYDIDTGTTYFSGYVPVQTSIIHNAPLGAGFDAEALLGRNVGFELSAV